MSSNKDGWLWYYSALSTNGFGRECWLLEFEDWALEWVLLGPGGVAVRPGAGGGV